MHFIKLSLLPLAFGLVQAQTAAFKACIGTCGNKADPTGEWLKCVSMETAKIIPCFCSITGFVPKLVPCLESTCLADYKPFSQDFACSAGSSGVSSAASTMMTTSPPSSSPSSPPYPSPHSNKTMIHGTGSHSMMSSASETGSSAPTGSTPTYNPKSSNSSTASPSQSPDTGSAGSLQVLLQWPLAFALAAGALAAL